MPSESTAQPTKPPAQVIIHTDGACKGNPGPGGWAAILQYGEAAKALSVSAGMTTNNRMELRAAIHALEALKRPCLVNLVTDSQYVRQGITEWIDGWMRKGWMRNKTEPVKNADLWKRLHAAVQRHEPAGGVTWSWINGHAGHDLNERANTLAEQAALDATPADPTDLDPAVNVTGSLL